MSSAWNKMIKGHLHKRVEPPGRLGFTRVITMEEKDSVKWFYWRAGSVNWEQMVFSETWGDITVTARRSGQVLKQVNCPGGNLTWRQQEKNVGRQISGSTDTWVPLIKHACSGLWEVSALLECGFNHLFSEILHKLQVYQRYAITRRQREHVYLICAVSFITQTFSHILSSRHRLVDLWPQLTVLA